MSKSSISAIMPGAEAQDWQPQTRRRKRILAKVPTSRHCHKSPRLCPGLHGEAGGAGGGQEAGTGGEGAGLQDQEGGGIPIKSKLVTTDLTAGEHCRQGD